MTQGYRMKVVERTCEVCGGQILTTAPNQRRHAGNCARIARQQRELKRKRDEKEKRGS